MSLRTLAPLSLLLFAVVFLIIVVSSLGGDSDSSRPEPARGITNNAPSSSSTQQNTQSSAPSNGQAFYVVRPGDTLSTIASRTGVPIERLLALNPSVDPEGLVSGQRIKLRE
jgi:LysM repeat protein